MNQITPGAHTRRLALPVFACLTAACSTANWGGPNGTGAAGAARQQLTGYITPAMRAAPVVGPMPLDEPIALTLGIPVRDRKVLKEDVESVSDPKSMRYRQYITPEEFGERYGASAEDYQAVVNWGRANHFLVKTHANRFVLGLSGTVRDVEAAFDIKLKYATRPDGTRFHEPDREPSTSLSVPVESIANLSNYFSPTPQRSSNGTGPDASLTAYDLRSAYTSCAPSNLNGRGQYIGICNPFEHCIRTTDWSGYVASSGLRNWLDGGLPPSPAGSVDGLDASIWCHDGGAESGAEIALDIEMAVTLAPAAQVEVIAASPGGTWTNFLTVVSDHVNISQSSCSYNDVCGFDPTEDDLLSQLALQGQSMLMASGDNGGYTRTNGNGGWNMNTACFDEQAVTFVGGTYLTMNDSGSGASATAWAGSGGGFFLNQTIDGGTALDGGMPIPSYQKPVVGENDSGASVTYRNVPDIALVASDIDDTFQGVYEPGPGTSYSTPLFAGFLALANQQALATGNKPLGFANPALYSLAGTGYVYDITSGATQTNSCVLDGGILHNPGCVKAPYSAVPGYDLTTGIGSPTCYMVTELASIQASPWQAETSTASGLSCVREVAGSENALGAAYGPAAAWAIGCTHSKGNIDYDIYSLSAAGGTWTQQGGGAAHISVSTSGVPWISNTGGEVFQLETACTGGSPCTTSPSSCCWVRMNGNTGNPAITYIAAGPSGTAWATSQAAFGSGGDNTVYYYSGGTWTEQSGVGFHQISVSNNVAVARNTNGTTFTSNGTNGATWIAAQLPTTDVLYDGGAYTGQAYWVAASPSLSGHQDSIAWAILNTPWVSGSSDYMIAEFVQRSAGENVWMQVPGGARSISVSPGSGRPWAVNNGGTAFYAGLGYSQ